MNRQLFYTILSKPVTTTEKILQGKIYRNLVKMFILNDNLDEYRRYTHLATIYKICKSKGQKICKIWETAGHRKWQRQMPCFQIPDREYRV